MLTQRLRAKPLSMQPTPTHGSKNRSAAQRSLAVPPIVDDALRSPGHAMDPATCGLMGARFGWDFSHVRVHTDAVAARSAAAVNARAFTWGQDVVFGHQQLAPETDPGRQLLAHELTHVVQHGGRPLLSRPVAVGPRESPLEDQAERWSSAVTASHASGDGRGGLLGSP